MTDHTFCTNVAGAIGDYLWQELQLHPRKNDYRILAATSGPRVLTLSLLINPRYASKIIGLSEQLSMAAGLDRTATIRAARGNRGTIALEIPKPSSLWYNIGVQALPKPRGLKAPIGIDGEHRPVLVDFNNPLPPHLLAAGTTGSGKTNSCRLFVHDLVSYNTPDRVQLILIDTRKRGAAWSPFQALPHLAHPIISDDTQALRALAWTVAEIDRRAVGAHGRAPHPHIFLAIDEAQALLDRPQFTAPICDIAAVGREFHIHLLLATQRPTAEMLGTTAIKSNLTTRLVGKVDSPQTAAVAAGIKDTGAHLLTGPGDQLLIQPSGTTRITAALITNRDTDTLPRTDQIPSLDLDPYDDIDHVLDQASNTTRRADPLDPAQLAYTLAHPGASQNQIRQQFNIGFPKTKRLQTFAAALTTALTDLGYAICNGSTVQRKPKPRPRNTKNRHISSVALHRVGAHGRAPSDD